jgi:hypothetical protein
MEQPMAGEQEACAVADYVVGVALREAALPHIVVYEGSGDGPFACSGPYATGVEAMIAAEREAALEGWTRADRPMPFGIAPLYPPLDVVEAD